MESDYILTPHGDGLHTRFCTRILLEFFVTNLTLVQGKSGHQNRLCNFCADSTNLIGHVEEDTVRNRIPRSLITHPNLYDHQANGPIILFRLADRRDILWPSGGRSLLKDYDCSGPAKSELREPVLAQ